MSNNNIDITQPQDAAMQPNRADAFHLSASSQMTLPRHRYGSPTSGEQEIKRNVAPPRCPYHQPIIQLVRFPSDDTRGYVGLDRYLKEESSQQYAVFLRPDDGLLSLTKNCTCGQRFEKGVSKL